MKSPPLHSPSIYSSVFPPLFWLFSIFLDFYHRPATCSCVSPCHPPWEWIAVLSLMSLFFSHSKTTCPAVSSAWPHPQVVIILAKARLASLDRLAICALSPPYIPGLVPMYTMTSFYLLRQSIAS